MTRVLSDMVANVWKVPVSAGDHVEAGEVIVVLESMKTEIPIESPHAGTVVEVRVVEGGTVGEGDVLAIVRAP